MRRVVAVEKGLGPVAEALQQKGYEVVDTEDDLADAGAVVVSGTDDNLLGIQDTLSKAPVINAEGRTPEEIVEAVEECMSLQE